MWLNVLLAAAIGYLMGSIPVGYLVGKAWGVDVRQTGSGRTGTTNVWRATRQTLPLVLTVVGDILKGGLAVLIGRYVFHSELAAAAAGAGAVLGHNWSFALGWRGGAGGITAGAALAVLSPVAAIVVVPLALFLLYLSRYASVATLTVAVGGLLSLAVLAFILQDSQQTAHIVFGVLAAAAILIALRPNIKRLVEGNERRI